MDAHGVAERMVEWLMEQGVCADDVHVQELEARLMEMVKELKVREPVAAYIAEPAPDVSLRLSHSPMVIGDLVHDLPLPFDLEQRQVIGE